MKKHAEMAGQPNTDAIKEQVNRINKSKGFARSKINNKLLNFLVNYHLDALQTGSAVKAPKEFEIAVGALDKSTDFNPAEDSSIRVYISNLRKKLQNYYKTEGVNELFHISIPTGGYGLEFNWHGELDEPVEQQTVQPHYKRHWMGWALVFSVAVNVFLALNHLLERDANSLNLDQRHRNIVKQDEIWHPLFASNKPTLLVIGDLFMLTEVDPSTNMLRAVREFGVNSDADFEDYLTNFPEKRSKTYKASSAFLLKNSVYALQHLLPLFNEHPATSIRLASELTAGDLRDYNIVYLGLYKTLGLLDGYLQGSNFVISKNRPELKHKQADKLYQVTGDLEQEYTDYGSFAKFNGPSGNLFYIFSGFSDASVIQIAKYLTNPKRLNSADMDKYLSLYQDVNANYELIFSASSYNRTDLDSMLVDAGKLDTKAIWAMPK